MNAFEAGIRKVIPATLIYVTTSSHVLMMHRILKKDDTHQGKWNGLGGKLELSEDPLSGAARELEEESGLVIDSKHFQTLGVLQFPNFKPVKTEDWLVWVYRVDVNDLYLNQSLLESVEGKLKWIPKTELLGLPLWEGDLIFLPKVLEGSRFFGTLWYENGKLIKSKFY